MSRRSLYFRRKLGYVNTGSGGAVFGISQCGGNVEKFVATFPTMHVRDAERNTITAPMSSKKRDRFSLLTTKGR